LDTNYLILIAVACVGGIAYFFFNRDKKTETEPEKQTNAGSVSLQLQAYERLTLLVDRITLSNLISRTAQEALSARDMQQILTRNIRDEFDYNITQQIYITPETWKAVKKLKERNLLLINQAAMQLPPQATATELSRAILEKLMNDPQANQHELVSEALSYEAKKLL
jgi:hypothetical protein